MRRSGNTLVFLCPFVLLAICAFSSPIEAQWQAEHLPFGVPESSETTGTLIVREGYVLFHNDERRLAAWVAYRLDPEDRRGIDYDDREAGVFQGDPALDPHHRAEDWFYGEADGYDRGHLAPAADMKKNLRTFHSSYYLSNIAPQMEELNRGEWVALENHVRSLLEGRGELWVLTGPAFEPGTPEKTIRGGLPIPTHFWKIIVDRKADGSLTAVSFVLPNSRVVPPWYDCATTIDEIERMTGWDFFPALPDNEEEELESQVTPADWNPHPVWRTPDPRWNATPTWPE
ncbi:DNA/RNA non-specific endonuclease [bacterium]|nr:DNA/RNA non-specific endonuclease [bacterium]